MGELVDLGQYREKALEQRAFCAWRKRFGESFSCGTRLGDLSDSTLFCLAGIGEKSTQAFYDFIIGALSQEKHGSRFEALDRDRQMAVIDRHLFMSDQARFEMMRRLRWLSRYPCEDLSLMEMVLAFESIKNSRKGMAPVLSRFHPQYDIYVALSEFDKETFIRTLLPYAIEAFKTLLD